MLANTTKQRTVTHIHHKQPLMFLSTLKIITHLTVDLLVILKIDF